MMIGLSNGSDSGGIDDEWSLNELSILASKSNIESILGLIKIGDGDGDGICDGTDDILVKSLFSQN